MADKEPVVQDVEVKDYSNEGAVQEKVDQEKGVELMDSEISNVVPSGGFEKTVFDKMTKAKVASVKIFKAARVDSDKQGKKYEPIYVQIESKVNGDKSTIDNYGGIRRYVDDGHWWVGEDSDAGKLKKKIADLMGKPDPTLGDMKATLVGTSVQIKTEKRSYQGTESLKNVIQAILME